LVNHVVPHEELLPSARSVAADIVSNDQRALRRLLSHYRQLASTSSLNEAHLLEGYMAETWELGTTLVADRRSAVIDRGRSQPS
jgi:enoyl-CoA hydratase